MQRREDSTEHRPESIRTVQQRLTLRRGLLVGLALQFALIAIGLWSVAANRSHEQTFERPVESVFSQAPIVPESGQPIADAYARQWSDSARLVAVTMRLEWAKGDVETPPTELPGRGWIIYVYVDGIRTLSLYLDRGTGILIGSNETRLGRGDWAALDLTTYPRSSSIAALTANITTGQNYRLECPESRAFALLTASSIKSEDPGSGDERPFWSVTYGDSRFPGTFDVVVQLDAVSGEVLTNTVRNRSCES